MSNMHFSLGLGLKGQFTQNEHCVIIYSHLPNLYELLSSVEHKIIYFKEWNQTAESWLPLNVDYQHSSKYISLSSTEERNLYRWGLEHNFQNTFENSDSNIYIFPFFKEINFY